MGTRASGIVRLIAAALAPLLFASLAAAACAPDKVALRGPWGEAHFTVEIADDPAERGQGLMFRETMARSAGMLFIYEAPQEASFWMKNTLIPLDMIFFDRTGLVRHVHHRAVPGDLTPIMGGRDILMVLEINGGLAGQLGLAPGDSMRHPAIDQADAAWPC